MEWDSTYLVGIPSVALRWEMLGSREALQTGRQIDAIPGFLVH